MGIRCADHVTPLYPQKLSLTSPTVGGRSVGIVCSRTKATEFFFVTRQFVTITSVFFFRLLSTVCDYALFLHCTNLFLSVHSYLFVCTCAFVFCFLYEFSFRAPLAIDSPFPCLTPTTYIVRGNVSCCLILRWKILPLGAPNVTTSDVVTFRVVHNVFLKCYR